MATIKTDLICNLNQPVNVTYLHGNLFSQDNAGNTINVFVMDNGEPATIGGTVSANVIRSDGQTVAVSGAIEGNRAYVILPQACYAVPGVVHIIIKLTQNTTITTIAAIVANVYMSTTDAVIDPGTVIPSIQALMALIEGAVDSIPTDYTGLLHTIAADYSSSKTYKVGDYAWESGVLKRCIVPITAAETYTAAHWTNAVIGDDLTNLKSAITDIRDDFTVIEDTFIGKTNGAAQASTSYVCTDYINVLGNIYVNTSASGESNAGYAFYDKNKKYIANSGGSIYEIKDTLTKLVPPDGASYFRISCQKNRRARLHVQYALMNNVSDLIKAKGDIEDAMKPKLFSLVNNLYSDGVGNLSDICDIYKDNVSSPDNYGLEGARYDFKLAKKSFRLYFEFRLTEPISYDVGGSATITYLLNAFNGHIVVGIKSSYSYANDMRLVRNMGPLLVSNNSDSTQNSSENMLIHMRYENMKGQDAISVRYDGTPDSSTSASIRFTSTATVVNVNGNQTTIACNADTTLLDLVNSLNAVDGIIAEALLPTGHTFGDLMPVVAKVQSGSAINLICTGTISGTTYYDNPNVYIPLALDDKWHSIEVYYDSERSYVYAAYDGLTLKTELGDASTNNIIRVGYDGAPVMLKNLKLDYGHFGEAEIISNQTDPDIAEQYPPADVIISEYNPRLLVYEGHGIDVQTDEKTPTESGMSCSVERLNILFSEAQKRGYVPVSWKEIIDWKIKGKPLPKRCYTIMFDDWRFANFVDHKKRTPFVKYGVLPALAVITDTESIDGTVVIDGITYNVRDVVNMTELAGWYPASHTKDHRTITAYKPSESGVLFNEDIHAADVYGIHSDVIVYPGGNISGRYIPVLRHTDFVLGVTIFSREYNCRAINDFYIGRVELGNRVPLATVLYPLV